MNKILLLTFFLAVAGFAPVAAQEAFPGGLLLDDEAVYDGLPRLSRNPGLKTALPAFVSLEAYCPEVRHQGDIYSCVGWAVGYGALSIQRAIYNQCTDRNLITRQAHSAVFLFNQVTTDCQKGARLSDAMAFLKEKGDCLAREFDLDVNDCDKLPAPDVAQRAKRFAIADYLTLFEPSEPYQTKVEQVKTALANKKAVVVGLQVRKNFYQLQQARFWWPDLGNTTPAGGHALVVVGYDDRAGAFRLFNSWGPNWGERGYIWIKYEHFAQHAKYGYVLQLFGASGPSAPHAAYDHLVAARPMAELAGAFQFRHLTVYAAYGKPAFGQDIVRYNGRYYNLRRQDWTVGRPCQLLVMSGRPEEYLYVFSIDARRQVKVHFPREEQVSGKIRRESGLVLPGNAAIVIPGPEKALQLATPGTDRLIVLYCRQPINDLDGLCRILAQYQGDFWSYLLRAIQRYVIPPSDIQYAPQQIQFKAQTRSAGYIVPLMLEVECGG